jgi:integrase
MAQALTDLKQTTRFANPDHPVFASSVGTPVVYGNIYDRVLQPALKSCGLAGQGTAFHAFRKVRRSMLLLKAGKDPRQVQQWLDHSQLTTTMNIYVHELDDGLGGADDLDTTLGSGHPGKGPETRADHAARHGATPGPPATRNQQQTKTRRTAP